MTPVVKGPFEAGLGLVPETVNLLHGSIGVRDSPGTWNLLIFGLLSAAPRGGACGGLLAALERSRSIRARLDMRTLDPFDGRTKQLLNLLYRIQEASV